MIASARMECSHLMGALGSSQVAPAARRVTSKPQWVTRSARLVRLAMSRSPRCSKVRSRQLLARAQPVIMSTLSLPADASLVGMAIFVSGEAIGRLVASRGQQIAARQVLRMSAYVQMARTSMKQQSSVTRAWRADSKEILAMRLVRTVMLASIRNKAAASVTIAVLGDFHRKVMQRARPAQLVVILRLMLQLLSIPVCSVVLAPGATTPVLMLMPPAANVRMEQPRSRVDQRISRHVCAPIGDKIATASQAEYVLWMISRAMASGRVIAWVLRLQIAKPRRCQ
mmetsp:Transcript_67662/g.161432  ORF Transcript_67662/g.161432 Transcript_67662/m.161432 type:complete len:284 (-) Transcript_67662:142-993(-)